MNPLHPDARANLESYNDAPNSTYCGKMQDKVLKNIDTTGWGEEAKFRYKLDLIRDYGEEGKAIVERMGK